MAMNLVQTLDGAAALSGKAWVIGTEVDHYLYRTLHGVVDAVLSGAGTLRLDDVVAGTHPHLRERRVAAGLPPSPTAVVLTATASFDDAVFRKRFFARGDFPSLVLTTGRAHHEDIRRILDAGTEVEVVRAEPGGRVDVEDALRALARRGLRRVLAEGGPTLATVLLRRRLVRQFFLTLTLGLAADPAAIRILSGPVAALLDAISVFHYLDASGSLREIYFRFDLTYA